MQLTDNELSVRCMNVLIDNVGAVDAERFMTIVNCGNFDYTEWQKTLFGNETVDSLGVKLKAFEATHHAPRT